MFKKLLATTFSAMLLTNMLFAQQQRDVSQRFTRFSAELGAGVPILFGSIPNKFTMFGTFGLRYSLSKEISIQGALQYGTFRGEQTPAGPYVNPSKTETNFYSFRNNFLQYSANVQINLEPLFKLRRIMPRLNPYILVGMGRIQSDIQTERLVPDGTKKTFDIPNRSYYTQYYGLVFRYYLNPQLDFVVSAIYHTTQSPVIDGIPTRDIEDFDSYLMPSLGINYKVGAKKRAVEHVDWYNVKSKKNIIDPDYPGDKPVTEKKDSVTKAAEMLAAQNDSLQKANAALKAENDALKASAIAAGAVVVGKDKDGNPIYAKDSTKTVAPVAVDAPKSDLNDGITTPPHKYNVVVGCYTSKRYAYIYRDRMRSKGLPANIYRTGQDSRMLRVTILSTDDRAEAQRLVNKARKTIDPGSWMHIYNKP
jgi:hypothetical protein